MKAYVQFIKKSANRKTGKIPTTHSDRNSCPDTCSLKENGCYAHANFHTRLNWDKLTAGERGGSWSELLDSIASLPEGQLWRHNVSGDLSHAKGHIHGLRLGLLVKANKGKRGFTYTHHDPHKGANSAWIEDANKKGFTINLSADNPAIADELVNLGIGPVVSIVAADQMTNMKTPAGNDIVICPAVTHEDVTCSTCKLCAVPDRKVIIGFPAHGAQKGRIVI